MICIDWRILRRLRSEWRVMGGSMWLISMALVILLALFALFAGDLLDVGCMGYEVVFPFYAAVAVGEWGKIRADGNVNVIVSQCRSAFGWVIARYVAVIGAVSLFAVAGMGLVSMLRREMPFTELLAVYFPTAFFLSSLAMLAGLFAKREHVASTACGVICLAVLTAQGVLRFPPIRYVYLFVRFAGVREGIWVANKCILCAAGAAVWCGMYWRLKKGWVANQ